MTSGTISAFIAGLVLGYIEALRHFYPAHKTWLRLRSRNGRRAVRAMRLRLEDLANSGITRRVGLILLALVIVWIAVSPALDKRWYEVAVDVLPYVFVLIALLRAPGSLRAIAERMKGYERDKGEDPGLDFDEDPGTDEIAL